jgi:hypothetical protein
MGTVILSGTACTQCHAYWKNVIALFHAIILLFMCEYTVYHIIFFRINRNLFCSYKVCHRIIDTRYAKGNIILLSEMSNI